METIAVHHSILLMRTLPQSIRWFYLSKKLSKIGYYIDNLTIRMPETFRDMLDELHKVYCTFPVAFYYFTFKYQRIGKQKNYDPTTLAEIFIGCQFQP